MLDFWEIEEEQVSLTQALSIKKVWQKGLKPFVNKISEY